MQLYLIRHAEAASLGSGRVRDDADRPLTARGRGDVRRAAGALDEKGVRLDRMLTSPRMRAVQTAEILAAGVDYRGEVSSLPLLGHTEGWRDGLEPVLDELGQNGAGSVAVVGHNPDLSDLTAVLLSVNEGTLALPAGAICLFELASSSLREGATLAWWLDPRDFTFRYSF